VLVFILDMFLCTLHFYSLFIGGVGGVVVVVAGLWW
jgi:hypothetical protein